MIRDDAPGVARYAHLFKPTKIGPFTAKNAVKYAGGAEDRAIRVLLSREGEDVVLSVADHGPGVPPVERERVFADFYRPGEELTRETAGTGIGLALVRRLAESMGGRVELTETPGGGATFRVALRPA